VEPPAKRAKKGTDNEDVTGTKSQPRHSETENSVKELLLLPRSLGPKFPGKFQWTFNRSMAFLPRYIVSPGLTLRRAPGQRMVICDNTVIESHDAGYTHLRQSSGYFREDGGRESQKEGKVCKSSDYDLSGEK